MSIDYHDSVDYLTAGHFTVAPLSSSLTASLMSSIVMCAISSPKLVPLSSMVGLHLKMADLYYNSQLNM